MEWQLALLFSIGILILLFATGLPIAFCFLAFNIVGFLVFLGGEDSLHSLVLSMVDSVTKFVLLPIPLFILLGSMMFYTGVGVRMIDVLGKLLGRLPGRLSILAVIGGTLLATMGGSTAASAALLARTLLPEMTRRGYHKSMSLGPIMGSGVLAAIIPPSGQAVLLGSLASISISQLLISGIIPGLVIASCYAGYIIVRCWLQPSMAPSYEMEATTLSKGILDFLRYVLPLASIFLLTIGPIFLGVATPSEAAAMGTVGIFILAAVYKKLSWQAVKESVTGTARISVMLFIILLGSSAFSQILAFSGAAGGLSKFVSGLPLAPIYIHIAMLLAVLFLGTIMDITSIMMITIPIYLPIVQATHINPIWWGMTMLMTLETGTITPPFGVILFAMKGLVPPDITLEDIYKATIPFIILDVVGVVIIMTFPILALWLPGIMVR